jgi:uncharacterized protein
MEYITGHWMPGCFALNIECGTMISQNAIAVRVWLVFVAIALATSIAVPNAAQAIDCAKASADDEIAICQDKHLLEMDKALNDAYRTAYNNAAGTEKPVFALSQKIWLREERSSCKKNASCLEQHLDERTRFLAGRSKWGPGVPGKLVPVLKAEDRIPALNFSSIVSLLKFVSPRSDGERLFNKLVDERSRGLGMTAADILREEPHGNFKSESGFSTVSMDIVYGSASLISARISGGTHWTRNAHDIYDTWIINIDLEHGKELEFTDVFRPGAEAALGSLCSKQGGDPSEMTAEWQERVVVALTQMGRWSFDPDGASLDFPPYSLMGYLQPVYGCRLSSDDLTKYTKPDFSLWQK